MQPLSPQEYILNQPDAVACNFVPVAVDILHVAVVSPLVRHVECGRDGAPVGVTADRVKDALVKLLVQVIEAVVEGEDDELRRLRSSEVAGDLGAATVAVR